MPIRFQKWITREDVRNNPGTFYVFGDNTRRKGLGGQANAMRGEPNAIGVATKWAPDNLSRSFFSDDEPRCAEIIQQDLMKIRAKLEQGFDVVIPADGLGTGLSRLPERAPILDKMIKTFLITLAEEFSEKPDVTRSI